MAETVKPSKQTGFVTLDSIVRSYLMDISAGMERYEQGKHWAIEGYRDFKFDVSREIKTTELSLTAWKAVELPQDCIPNGWVMIGVRINGFVRVFTNDNSLALYFDDNPPDGNPDIQPFQDDVYNPTSNQVDQYWFWNMNSNGEDKGQLFGLTVKDNGMGYYRYNPIRKEIQFNPSLSSDTKIYMEYISDGYNPCEKTCVNVLAAKAIKLYCHWQRLKFSKSSNRAEVADAKTDYYDEFSKVNGRIHPLTIADVLEVARNGYHLTPYL